MAKLNCNSYRRDRCAELRQLANVLERHQICPDVSPVNIAQDGCRNNIPNGPNSWGYQMNKLLFRIDHQKHTQPKEVHDLTLELSVTLVGECQPEGCLNDPFKGLAVDFFISAKTQENERCFCSWHHDRHIENQDGEDPQFAHPFYHFQHGGNKMWGGDNFGTALIFESPRIAHPPLDGVLAIDFVLSNFCGDRWRRLLTDREYLNLIEKAQHRFWRPYAISTASCWSKELPALWLPKNLWPQLVI